MAASRRPRVRPIVRHSARILGSAIGRRRVGNSRIMQSYEGWKGENGYALVHTCACRRVRSGEMGRSVTEVKARF